MESNWHWMTLAFRRYADFSGRATRQEFWMFKLLQYGGLLLGLMAMLITPQSGPAILLIGVSGILGLFVFATLVPSVAVSVRRLHDQDKSGWMFLLCFIPYVGWIIWLIFMCSEGTAGANGHGPDPKGSGIDVFL